MSSMYRRYPVGGLLVWTTEIEPSVVRGTSAGGVIKLLLDGQQRVTSLYGVIKGAPPEFFQGNAKAFTDLYFNVATETFEFYGPVKMRDDPFWISVTEVFQADLEDLLIAMADLAWPDGIQPGLAEPVAFLLEPDAEWESRLGELSYRLFLNKQHLIWHLETVLGVDIDGDDVIGDAGEESTAG